MEGKKERIVDSWWSDAAKICITESVIDGETWYDAKVKEYASDYAGTYEYEFGTDKPTREQVESRHADELGVIDLDRYDRVHGADGILAQQHGVSAW